MVVAEALGEREESDGLPLRPNADAGSVFQRALKLAGINREELLITNVVRCRPPGNILEGAPYEAEAIQHCSQHLGEAVQKYKPKVIVALGNVALRALTGLSGPHKSITSLRGYVLQAVDYPEAVVVPSYHPSHIKRGAGQLFRVLVEDLTKAIRLARGADLRKRVQWVTEGGKLVRRETLEGDAGFMLNPVEDHRLRYQTDPTVEDAQAFYERCEADPALTISYDIETDRSAGRDEGEDDNEELGSEITLVQFSTGVGTGIALPFGGDYRRVIRAVLALPNPKVGHNCWLFDNPILARADVPVAGQVDDTLWAWRMLQPDLPADLQFVASWFCLAAASKLRLWDGSTQTIKDVVEQRLPVTLMGMDTSGALVPVRVVDWHRTKNVGQRWVKINTESHRQPIMCTPDHNVLTEAGWKLAKHVSTDDRLYLPSQGSADLVHGTLMGDGCVRANNQLKLLHSTTQLEYAQAKAGNLGIRDVAIRSNGNGTACTFEKRIPAVWRRLFYPSGEKVFVAPPSVAALAIWYCDDGSWKKFNDRKSGDGTAVLAIKKSYDAGAVMDWLRVQFGENVRLGDYKSGRQAYIGGKSRDAFYERIAPWVPPAMYRKLPPKYRGQYAGWLERPVALLDKVHSVQHDYRPHLQPNIRYCVTVDHPTHRFFVDGGLVANCMPFAWKHLSGPNLRFYACADVDATFRIWQGLPEAMRRMKVWETYVKYVRGLRPVLDGMTRRGVAVDRDQLVAFGGELRTEIDRVRAAILPMVPSELTKFDEYTGLPADVREYVKARLPKMQAEIENWWPVGQKRTKKALAEAIKPYKEKLAVDGFEALGYERRNGGWAKPLEFNPGSWQQVLGYAKYKGHKVPVVSKKKNGLKVREESVNEKALLQISRRTKDPFYRLILDYREPSKMLGTYVGDVETLTGGFMPGPDGRVRADFTTRPANGQLSTRNGPPLQTAPAHGDLAKSFQRCLVASPGHVLVKPDYKSFHVLTLGFESRDEVYMRLARGDMHSFFTVQLLRLESAERLLSLDDREMKERLCWWRHQPDKRYAGPKGRMLSFAEVRDQQSKPTILGMGLGMQAHRLWEENEEFIPSKAEAQKLIDLWRALFPKEVKYQRDVRELAHRQHYLRSRYGFIRWFWNVMQWSGLKQQWEPGPDGEAAISHYVQNDAFGMMRDVMLALHDDGLDEKWWLTVNEHDALVFDCPRQYEDECVEGVHRLMSRPSGTLVDPVVAPEGLACQVEIKVGPSRAEMSEVKL